MADEKTTQKDETGDDRISKNGLFQGMSPRQIFEERCKIATANFGSGINRAHAQGGNIPQSRAICQERIKIASFLRSLHKTIPMPEQLRKERIRLGIPVPDPSVPFIVENGNNNPFTKDNGIILQ